MIKTKNGVMNAAGTKDELLIDFCGTAESLMRRTKITAEELHKAVKLAEMTVEFVEVLDKIDESSTVTLEEEEAEAENEPAEPTKAEEKEPEKGKLRVGKFKGNDIEGMLEWLKGELENLEDESDD